MSDASKTNEDRSRQTIEGASHAEAELRLWSNAFKHCAHGIAIAAASSARILVCNPALAQMLGRTVEEVAGAEILSLYDPDDHPRVLEAIAEADRSGHARYEARHTRADGTQFPVEVVVASVRDDSGNVLYRIASVRDITEQKRHERLHALSAEVLQILNDRQALPEAINRIMQAIKSGTGVEAVGIRLRNDKDFPYAVAAGFSASFLEAERSLAVQTPDGEFCFDAKGNVRLECTCGLALSAETDSSNPLFTPGGSAWTNDARLLLQVPADQDPRLHPWNRFIHEGSQSVALIPIRVKSEIVGLLQLNDRRKGCFTLEMIRFLEGLASSLGVALQRLQEDAELRESEVKYRLLSENSGDVIWLFDLAADHFSYVSPSIERLRGFSVHEVLAQSMREALTADSYQRVAEALPDRLAAMAAGDESARVQTHEVDQVRKDGSVVPTEVVTTLMTDAKGQVIQILGVTRDITARKQTAALLEAERRLLAEIIESSSLMICFKDREGRYQLINRAFETSLGRKREDLIGRTALEVFPGPDTDRLVANDRMVLSSGRNLSLEETLNTVDGQRFFTSAKFPLRDAAGGIIGTCSMILENTGQKLMERALRETEDRYRSLVEDSPDAIGIYQDDQLVFINSTGVRQLGAQSKEDVLGRGSQQVIHPDDRAAAAVRIRRRLAGDSSVYPAEVRYLRMDGTIVPVEVSAAPVQYSGRLAVQFTARDISERKRAEESLRASEQRFRHLVETSFDWIWETDEAGRYSYCSPKVQDLMGYAPDEILGRTPFDLMPAGEATRVTPIIQEVIKNRVPFASQEKTNLHKDGRRVVFESSGVPVFDGNGELLGYRGMNRDVTERRRLESQLREAQKLEAIGQLAGGVAHDFNNILAAILMQLGLLQMDTGLDPDISHALKDLEVEAQRAASLTRQLLMFSRRSVLDVKPLDLNDLVLNLIKMLGRLIGEQIKLSFDNYTGSLPSVSADSGMLEQVLMNLVVNARDAMPRGGRITIHTSVEALGVEDLKLNVNRQQGQFVCVTVSDTGVGMNQETLERIFEPFFTTKEPGKGTGLGLATVHGIVAQHKGWVEVESEVGQGSAFRVFLPALATKVTEKEEATPIQPLQRGYETVLVVEDESKVRQTIGHMLRVLGYRVHEAENGQQAVLLWQQHGAEVDLLLTDMVMPEGMTGLELAERLRSAKPDLKVIISSGYSSEIYQSGGIKQTGIWYLPKPFEAKTLAETIRACLDRK